MSQPTNVTGPAYGRKLPRPVHATAMASVDVPVAAWPSGVRIPCAISTWVLTSVVVMTAFTIAAGVRRPSIRRIMLIVPGPAIATGLRPDVAVLLSLAVATTAT